MSITNAAPALTATHRAPRVNPLGSTAMLFEAPGELALAMQQRIWALAEAAIGWPGIRDVQPGMTNLLVIYDAGQRSPEELGPALLRAWSDVRPLEIRGRTIEVPVIYGGERGNDLPLLAQRAGLSLAETVRLHAARDYIVFAPGTAGGFGYLFGLDERLFMPRRKTPVMRRVGGSVAIGGLQCNLGGPAPAGPAVTNPTGWNTIGYAPEVPQPFDIRRDPVTLLALGDRIRFRIDRIDA